MRSPDNLALEAVICPLAFSLKAFPVCFNSLAVSSKPPIIPEPVAIIFVAVISPLICALEADTFPAPSTWNALLAPKAKEPVLMKNP